MNELISIIVPVYKAESFLERCVESLINQTYKNLEIILVDDGSPDNSGAMCDEYSKKDNRIKVIHKENGGVSSARNSGIESATGDYIAFVDSDDWVELDMFEEMLKELKANNVDAVRCSGVRDDLIQTIDIDFLYADSIKLDLKESRNDFLNFFVSGKQDACIWCFLVKREFIDENLRFNTDIAFGEDLLFVVELICKLNTIYILNRRSYHYYVNPNSATVSPVYRKRNIKNLIVLNKIMNATLDKYMVLSKDKKEDFAFYCFYYIYIQLAVVVANEKDMDFVDEVIQNKGMKQIVESLNAKKLPHVAKTFYYLIKGKKKKILYAFCWLFDLVKNKAKF